MKGNKWILCEFIDYDKLQSQLYVYHFFSTGKQTVFVPLPRVWWKMDSVNQCLHYHCLSHTDWILGMVKSSFISCNWCYVHSGYRLVHPKFFLQGKMFYTNHNTQKLQLVKNSSRQKQLALVNKRKKTPFLQN